MSQPYNLADLLHPMFNRLLNCAGIMGLLSGQRRQKAVAYDVCTPISKVAHGNSYSTQNAIHKTQSDIYFNRHTPPHS